MAEVVDRDDAGMVEPSGGSGFRLKPLHADFRLDVGGKDQLDRDKSVQFDVPRLPNHAHAAAAELFDQLIPIEQLPGERLLAVAAATITVLSRPACVASADVSLPGVPLVVFSAE